jgi:hypothetical protein
MIEKYNYDWMSAFSSLGVITAEIEIFLSIKINKLAFANTSVFKNIILLAGFNVY